VPEPTAPVRAKLLEINLPHSEQAGRPTGRPPVDVDFNPETLKVTYSSTIESKDQTGGPSMQFVSKASTKLAVELWFDVTRTPGPADVRDRTELVKYFISPKPDQKDKEERFVPPGVRFSWGSFLFEGVMEAMDETLEFFSPEGRPLRARVTLSITSQEIQFRPPKTGPSGEPGPGTQPRQQLRDGESVQQLVGRSDGQQDWQQVAAANGIENPRRPAAGTFLDLAPGARGG
jgi:Contractile injection system tube protein